MQNNKKLEEQAMKKITVLAMVLFFILAATAPSWSETDDANGKTALLIIDVQDFYYPGGGYALVNPEAAGLNAQKLLAKFREKKMLVIHVRHNAKQNAGIHEQVKPLPGEKVISKNYVNSFRETDLLEFLNANRVKHLVLCGMQTHMCLEAATRAAADYGFDCTVVGDACATQDLKFGDKVVKAEDVHYSTLASLSGRYAKVVDTGPFLKEFGLASGGK